MSEHEITREEAQAWAKANLKKLTDEDVERAKAIAREQGWLTDDGFIWERRERKTI